MARKKKVTAAVESETGTATAVAELPTPPVKAPRKKRSVSVEAHIAPVESVAAPVASSVENVEAAPFDTADTPPAPALAEATAVPAAATTAESHQAASSAVPAEQPDRPRFRCWTVRTASGYEKLTDNKRGLLVLKFHDRPSEEILNAVKDGGFQYSPDYEGQGKAWLRKNDFEGRVQVDKIEAALRQQEQGAGAER